MTATIDLESAYRQLRGPLLSLVCRMTGTHRDAEDIVQEAFTYAWSVRDRFVEDAEHPAAPLMWTLTRRQIQTTYRDRRELAASDWMENRDWPTGCVPTPLSALNRGRLRKLVAAMGKLTDGRRGALVLHFAHGMQWSDVGEELGTTEAGARTAGHNALGQVRELLAEQPPVPTVVDATAEVLRSGVLDMLSPRRAEVARLRFLEGLGYKEIGARLGISAGTVHGHVKQINATLQAHAPEVSASCPVLSAAVADPDQLDLLTPRQRRAVLLRFRDGLQAGEVGRRMGIESHAVTRLCADARRRLAGSAVST